MVNYCFPIGAQLLGFLNVINRISLTIAYFGDLGIRIAVTQSLAQKVDEHDAAESSQGQQHISYVFDRCEQHHFDFGRHIVRQRSGLKGSK
jgi:hypothetical protein